MYNEFSEIEENQIYKLIRIIPIIFQSTIYQRSNTILISQYIICLTNGIPITLNQIHSPASRGE